jgi:cardiolipin synthase
MWVFLIFLLNTIFMVIIAIREVRRPAKALNWIVISLVLPLIGFVFYLSTTNPSRIRRERLTSSDNKSVTLPESFSHTASVISNSLHPLTVHGLQVGQVQVLTNGLETYEHLIDSLQDAQKTIDLEYYIYRDDQIGRRLTEVLIERAMAGLSVRFVRDGWGSKTFPKNQIVQMMDAGIECRTIFPLRFPWIFSNWNYRDHCKIVLIDGEEAFTGGINVGYEYTGLKPDVGFWRDTHLKMKGKACSDLSAIFDVHWNIASPERMKSRTNTRENVLLQNTIPANRTTLYEWSQELGEKYGNEALPKTGKLQDAYVQTLEGNPGLPTPVVRQAYFTCITQATQAIDITTPYFLPDEDIIMALKTAAARGVRIRLLVPHHIDQKIVGAASRTFYGELLEAGVQIYLYNKGMLHAKLMVIDGEIAEVGAANYDMRSFRLNYEVFEIIYSTDVARQLTEQFEYDLNDSIELRMDDIIKRSPSERFKEQGARLLFPLL